MAFWSPVSGLPQSEVRDGRLLAASAVSMSMNICLSDASMYVTSLRDLGKTKNGLSASDAQHLLEASEKAQLVCQSVI